MCKPSRIQLSTLLLMVWISAAPAAEKQRLRPSGILEGVRSVAILPSRVPFAILDTTPGATDVMRRLEALTSERLRLAGITVIEPHRVQELIDAEASRAPPIYDRFTRQRDPVIFRAVHSAALDRLLEQHSPDALIDLSMFEDFAEVRGGVASWQRVVESAAGRSAMADFMQWQLQSELFAPAVSIRVRVQLLPLGRRAETDSAGLQLLTAQTSEKDPPRKIPLLNDPVRESRAIDVTLGQWLMSPRDYQSALARAQRKPKPPPLAEPSSPPSFDPVAFRASHRTLALAPVEIALDDVPIGPEERYEAALTEELASLGFQQIAPLEFRSAWERAKAGSTGFFDPTTGALREGEREAVLRRTIEDLRARRGIDGIVFARVVAVHAHYSHGMAEWDGLRQSVSGATGKLAGLTTDADEYFGVVPATSLEVHVIDARGETVFRNRGGIEVTRKIERGISTNMPPEKWLRDSSRDLPAVRQALAPLAGPAAASPVAPVVNDRRKPGS